MFSKKSEVEVQFNWIFVLLAGGIILTFFFIVIKQQLAGSDSETIINVKVNLEAFLKNAKLDSGKSDYLPLNGIELEYPSCIDGYLIDGSAESYAIKLGESFSPSLLTSQRERLIYWSLEWRAPFKITNFLYLTTPEVRYIFVNDSNKIVKQLVSGTDNFRIPDKVTKEVISKSMFNIIQDLNNYKVRIVYFLDTDAFPATQVIPTQLKKVDVSLVMIYAKSDFKSSKVQFYKKSGANFVKDGPVVATYEIAPIYAAIFSEDKEHFDCGINKAIQKYNIINSVYLNVTKTMKDRNYFGCEQIYSSSLSELGNITKIDQIGSRPEGLKQLQKRALHQGCPYFY